MSGRDLPVARRVLVRGFTLLEVLVTLLVLAIGLLGLAALQATGLRVNHSAYLRSQVTVLSYDIADRMRANQTAVSAGGYDGTSGVQTPNCVASAGCSTADMAAHDIFEWDQALAARLPSGQGIVCIDGTPNDGTAGAAACDGAGSLYAIKIWWEDDRDTATAAQRFVTVFRP